WYELPPTLEDLSNLIIASMGKGQRQFETFLHELDQQLQVMTDFLSGHDERDQTWLDLSKQLEQSVNEKRIALELNADGQPIPELEKQLKDSIREHLEDISDIAVEFVKRGEKLSAGFQPELEAVQQGVQSLLLEQKKLRSQLEEERHSALEDVLTGLASREAYDERLEFEYLRWQRYKKPVALCAADIDHFDSINERYGHLSGDRTLQIIGKELKERMRKTDFVARYGGEKFIFILPVTKIDVAEQVMEKLRKTIMSLPLHFRAQRVKLTVSFGLVEFHECEHFSELSVKADQALAQAKRQGRNQVCVWHAEADKKNSEE
ncbi:GGDEF domain-containing protein, partial [Oleiphilus sp. HI0125]|uniref:GGDEF domain-containing protein n=1 Tax=Oleiphilus sp. HI0125 TaxID=1822266 RepID=UPI000A7C8B72